MKQLRLSIGRARVHCGVLLVSALTAGVGCSDDGAGTPPVDDVDSGLSTDQSLASGTSTGGNGESSSVVADTTHDTTGDGTLTAEPTSTDETSTPVETTEAVTSDVPSSDSPATDEVSSSADAGSTEPAIETTGDENGPVPPPGNMTVIANYDAVAGFDDSNSDVVFTRSYDNSMMSLDIPFTGTGQLAGVNHNYPGGSGDMCGHDLVARIRLTSGTINGGVQLRVWSDSWVQFSSQITQLPATGLGEWVEYRLTWEQAVANDDLGNGTLNIRALNAVGLGFMTFGDATAVHIDVDWIGLVPSDTPCPDDTGTDAGTSSAPVDTGTETSAPMDSDASAPGTSDVADGGASVEADASM